MVVTGPDLVEQGRLHLDAESGTVGFADLDSAVDSAPVNLDLKLGTIDQYLVANDVAGLLAVDGYQDIANENASIRCRRIWLESNYKR